MNEHENQHESQPETTPCCDECGCCGEELFETAGGRKLCRECLDSLDYIQCSRCGKWEDPDEGGEYNGDFVCSGCIEALGLERCDGCGTYHRSYHMETAYGGYRHPDLYLCRNCVQDMLGDGTLFRCDDCGDLYQTSRNDANTTADGNVVCETCRADHYRYCCSCDRLYHVEDLSWSDPLGGYACDACRDRARHRARPIRDYSYKPDPIFYGIGDHCRPTSTDPLTFGFENEVDRGSDRENCANEILDAFGEDVLYAKNDGSVDFEIVTHPRTLRSYLEDFDFDTLCDIPIRYGYKSHDAGTCGFHIHVGRKQLGATDVDRQRVIEKIVLLMYIHWDSLVKFSRRTESQLRSWAKAPELLLTGPKTYTECGVLSKVRAYYTDDTSDRYRALNLRNGGTIEFRLWRGSLKPVTLKATLQLTSNIVRFAMTRTVKEVLLSSWEDIVNFETCPELLLYVEENNLATGLPPKTIRLADPGEATRTWNTGFKVGDIVRIVGHNNLVSRNMIGAIGYIVGSNPTERYPDETVLHIVYRPDTAKYSVNLHDCCGLLHGPYGYFVTGDTIELFTEEFYVGQTVTYDPASGPDGCEDLPSHTGTIVYVDIRDGAITSYGVAVDNCSTGHDLYGHMPADRPQNCGWYFPPEDLTPVDNATPAVNF